MDILFVLIPISFVMALGGLLACVWAIRSGQYKDTESPAQKLVLEDFEDYRNTPHTNHQSNF